MPSSVMDLEWLGHFARSFFCYLYLEAGSLMCFVGIVAREKF
jgi:hypothetical protein